MQALSLKPSSGWQWIRAGWRLFRVQPFGLLALLFFFWLLLLSARAVFALLGQVLAGASPFVAEVISIVGSVLVTIVTPVLIVGFMQACRSAAAAPATRVGRPAHPMMLLAPFRAGRSIVQSLLTLGAIQMVALTLIVLVSGAVVPGLDAASTPTTASTPSSASGAPPPSPSSTASSTSRGTPATAPNGNAAAEEIDAQAFQREAIARALQVLLCLPVFLAMWYAPVLAAWHGLPAGKALFFSIVAVWRNLGAFVVYGLGWTLIWMALSFVFSLVVATMGNANFAAVMVVPLLLVLFTWMSCSMYPTYASVFVTSDDTRSPPVEALR